MRLLSHRLFLLAALMVGVVACSGSQPASAPTLVETEPPSTVVDVWSGLDAAFAHLLGQEGPTCRLAFGTTFFDFGVRGLGCLGASVTDLPSIVAQSGGRVFASGPHIATTMEVRLDLSSDRAFGRYDPAFVDWVAENAVLGAGNVVARALVRPAYEMHVQRLARIYWLAYDDLGASGASDPALLAYASFLDGSPIPDGMGSYQGDGFSVSAFMDRSETLLPAVDLMLPNDWTAKYEANTAYGFWLRRQADGTSARWHDALDKLLTTYDADWLATQQ